MEHNIPIWVSNWVVEYTGGRGKAPRFDIKEVIVKGENEQAIMNSSNSLRNALRILFQRKKKIDNELLAKYKPINIELIKQVGYGVVE